MSKSFWFILFGPGIRYVPDVVWHSKFFWIALAIMIVGILIYHNYKRHKMENGHFGGKRLDIFNLGSKPDAVTIRYTNEGRSGHVWYRSPETQFSMYYEFSGGNCVASIDIPSPETWEKVTKLPLNRRDEVLESIGRQVTKDQVSSGKGYFKIEGNWLHIYV